MPWLPINHRPQEKPTGCLAACAQMALAHIDVAASQRKLNRLFGLTSMGVPWPHVQRLTQWGLRVHLQVGQEVQLKQAIDQQLPPITFIRTGELTTYWNADLQHAVLLVGYDDTQVYLNDPAFADATQRAPWGEFMLAMLAFNYTYALITH